MLIVEAFSLTRTTWTPMLAAWLILPVLTWGWAGVSSAVRRGAVMAVALVALLGIASAGTFGPTAQAMAVRAMSVTDSGLTKDPSLQDRLLENEAAWAQIKEHPIAGIGFPRAYGAFQYTYDAETDFTENLPKHFIHQTYLGIWLWFGVPGIVALLARGSEHEVSRHDRANDDYRRTGRTRVRLGIPDESHLPTGILCSGSRTCMPGRLDRRPQHAP